MENYYYYSAEVTNLTKPVNGTKSFDASSGIKHKTKTASKTYKHQGSELCSCCATESDVSEYTNNALVRNMCTPCNNKVLQIILHA